MSRYALPAPIQSALEDQFQHRARRQIIDAQSALSAAYRSGATSTTAIKDDSAALAYAAARMPATFAAIVRALDELVACRPDFAPQTILDVGAGPGTGTIAAQTTWASINAHHMIEPNAAMRRMANALLQGIGVQAKFCTNPAAARADLAIVAYVLAELRTDQAVAFVAPVLTACKTVVIVEPGTPQGFARINAVRDSIRETHPGCIMAPCTHEQACPMKGDAWCHFNVRLPRSRLHRDIKAADAPFEDERMAYLVAGLPPAHEHQPIAERIMADPQSSKFQTVLRCCGTDGLRDIAVAKRDKPTSKSVRHLRWGDRWLR